MFFIHKNKIILFCCLLLQTSSSLLAQFSKNDLLFWLRSDTSIVTSGNNLNSWNDISGNNFNFTSILTPTVNSNSLNGYQSISFNNSSLSSNNLISINNFNAFVVYKKNGSPINYERIIDHDYASGFWIGRNSVGNNNFGSGYKNLNPPLGIFGNFPDTLVNIIHVCKTNNKHYLYNGYNLQSNQILTNSSPTANNKIMIGSDIASNGNFSGDIYEIIFFNDSISLSNKDSIISYLYKKYSPNLNLGPDIDIPPTIGCIPSNTTSIQANPNFKKYLWNNGNSTNQININQYGEYSVICIDDFGLSHYDTINVIPTPKNFNYPSNNALCGTSSITWNTQLNNLANQFQWQDNSTDSLITIANPGAYHVTITDTFGCVYNSNTLTVIQDNFAASVSLGPDLSLCAGNSINLVSGTAPSLTYTWSTGSNNNSITVTNSGQYSVIVTNTNSCVAKDTINVTISGLAPVANFTSSISCKNNAVSFTDLSLPPSGNSINSYDWNFGDLSSGAANTSTLSNPFHTFSDTGNYSITLKIITNVGCEQSITKTIHVAPKPVINFSVGLSCQNDSTSFFGSISNPTGYSTSSLTWNFGDPSSGSANSATTISPKHVFSNQTNYTIKLIATNNAGCKDSLLNIIAVKGQVKADFTYSSACTNTATLFQDNSIAPAPNSSNIRSWNFGTSTASGLTVSKSYTNSGVYSVTLSVTGNNGCNSSISKVITIFNPPVTSFTIPAFCVKDTITINNSSIAQSGVISSYNWKLNNSSFSSIQNPTLSISTAGSYSVSLTVANNFGCRDSLTKPITVNPLPIVDFSTNPALYYYINEPVSFIPSITNANFYFWNISSAPTTTVQSPTVSFNNQGTYTASLLLQDQQGCKNSISKNLTVAKRFLDIGVLNVNSSKDADGFVTVQTDIVNYGTIPAYAIELNYQVSDGGNIKETWTGTLVPNNYFTYTFNSKIATQPHSSNHITCVDARKVNGINDENAENNKLCSALNSNDISVSNPIPNPTSSDIVLPVILNKDLTFSITIYNSTGQIIYEEPSQNGITGLNLITIPSSNYARGCYIIKTVIDDKIFIKKFIKISNE